MRPDSRLFLLRHAKSSWDDPALPDQDRPLAARGQRAVALLRKHLETTGADVELVLCSPARRTRETWAGVRAGLRQEPAVRFVPGVYGATAAELLGLVREVDEAVRSVMIVGHNPGMQELASGLAAGDAGSVERLGGGFPPGGLATFVVAPPWSELAWGSAVLAGFVRPRELPDG